MKASLGNIYVASLLEVNGPNYNRNEWYHFPRLIAITRRNLSENGRQESKTKTEQTGNIGNHA